MTGQPIAISNVRQDARFNQDFAKSTGYVPRSILATPLVSNGSVIGVMEVLDKINAPSFGMQDMELLGIFARQAAIAIHQSQQVDRLGEALVQGLKKLAWGNGQLDSAEISAVLENALKDGSLKLDLQVLSALIYDIGALGEAERKACLQILEVFREYGSSRPRLF
jgi:GAF domain-containing protein